MLLMIAFAHRVFACATAPGGGEHIDVVDESAIIIWDPATKTEHFIRRATFNGDARSFGFLVPTPAAPTLSAVRDDLFDLLNAKTRPRVERRTQLRWTFLPTMDENATTAARGGVEVLQTAKIAGYDAVVLDATDGSALHAWLEQHGYATTPDLEEWLAAYVEKRWIITAFKIDKTKTDQQAQTEAVKMSFHTDRPFFPYREPVSQRQSQAHRVLRVFFLGPERVDGTIGDAFWPGFLKWSDHIDGALRAKLVKGIGENVPSRLSSFVDIGTRSGTDELFFSRTADQRAHFPPPIIEVEKEVAVPLDLYIFSMIILFGLGLSMVLRQAFFPQ
jgi:hypothetical protein